MLVAAWVALFFTIDRASVSHRLLLIAGAGLIATAAVAAASPTLWGRWGSWRARHTTAGQRIALAVTPWIGLAVLVLSRGLWWTQRPAAMRLFALALLLNWSFVWLLGSGAAVAGPQASVRAATRIFSVGLFVLAFEGLAFGLTPFGCGTSALLAIVAAWALALATEGSHTGRLKLLAASAATLVAFAAIEVGVRALHLGVNLQERDNRTLARQFYTLTPPGATFVHQPTPLDEFPPALIEINSLGIRGPELSEPRADVLLVGDSFVEARQLAWDLTVGPRLQEALSQRGVPLRVVGHGVRGWSPLLEWNWYRKVGRSLEPRVVVLFFFWNDLWTEGSEARTFSAVFTEDGRPDYFDVPVESPWIWYQHVRSLRLLDAAWQQLTVAQMKRSVAALSAPSSGDDAADLESAAVRQAGAPPLTSGQINALLTQPVGDLDPSLGRVAEARFWLGLRLQALWTDAQREAAAVTEDELRRFAEDVSADGGRLVLMYVPNPLQIDPRECTLGRFFDRVDRGVLLPPDSGVQAWLREVTDRQRIEFLDPSEAMRSTDAARPDAPPLYLRADCHWSPAGHQFVADYLADWLERNGGAGPQGRE